MLRSMTWECTCTHAVLNLAACVGRSFHYHNKLAGATVGMVKVRLLSGRECALPPLKEEGYNIGGIIRTSIKNILSLIGRSHGALKYLNEMYICVMSVLTQRLSLECPLPSNSIFFLAPASYTVIACPVHSSACRSHNVLIKVAI